MVLKLIKAIESYNGFNITFQVTEDCNMACTYCYEVNKKPTTLSLDNARKFIDIILTDKDPINAIGTDSEWILSQGLIIDFIGGDALMVPELCDAILSYFQYKAYELNHRWKDRWRCSISTNGTLLGEPRVQKFLNKYKGNLSLGISLDGCPEIHDKNRVFKNGKGSFSTIKENWDWYLNYAGDTANTKATLNKDSIPYIYESIKYLHENLGLKYINMNFIFEEMNLQTYDYWEIEHQFYLSIDYIYEHRHDLHVNMFSEEFGIGNPMTESSKCQGWCGAGSMPCLTVNGKIYPCFRFVPNTMTSEAFDLNVGDVETGFSRKENFELVRQQTRDLISPETCRTCETESTCAWCIGGAFSANGHFSRTISLCTIKKLINKYSRLYWNRFYNKEVFKI